MSDRGAYDAVIVGSGAGGGTLAWALSRAGWRVLVLEKGPHLSGDVMLHDELAETRRNLYVPFVADEPHEVRTSMHLPAQPSRFGWIACCVGGGTTHWAGYAHRLAPDDFRRRTVSGGVGGAELADWPITYDDLEPYYARAELELGVSGTASSAAVEPRRSAPLPLPPLRNHPLGGAVEAGAAALGWTALTTPRAILSAPHQGRPPCSYCRFCTGYRCASGSKGSTEAALLPRALATGRCELRPQAMVKEIRIDPAGRATGVVWSDSRTPDSEHESRGRVVIVACSAVESARLLLRSQSALFPDGLANSSGLVGKHLMMLTRGGAAADFLFAGASGVPGLEAREPFIGRSVRDHYASAGLLSVELGPAGPIGNAERLSIGEDGRRLWGATLKERLRAYYREGRHVEIEAYSECLPLASNKVELGDTTDRYGLPVARITFDHHTDDVARNSRLTDRAVELLGAMRADRLGARMSGLSFDVLQSGTCRFGDDPSRSVLDRDCRAHDVPNLYVVDGSFMPNSGAVPPTLTIVANALRVAEAMLERARRGEHG